MVDRTHDCWVVLEGPLVSQTKDRESHFSRSQPSYKNSSDQILRKMVPRELQEHVDIDFVNESTPLSGSTLSYGTVDQSPSPADDARTIDTDPERAETPDTATKDDGVHLSPNIWSIVSVLLLGIFSSPLNSAMCLTFTFFRRVRRQCGYHSCIRLRCPDHIGIRCPSGRQLVINSLQLGALYRPAHGESCLHPFSASI
jgi:hypothetical protein